MDFYAFEIGGFDRRILPGQVVTIHGKQNISGVIVLPPRQLLPPELHSGPLPMQYLLIDTGLEARQVERLVKIGDRISYAQPPVEMSEDILAGHGLDNRASVAGSRFVCQW
jgi:endoglucanase